jgi:hypothetical protein
VWGDGLFSSHIWIEIDFHEKRLTVTKPPSLTEDKIAKIIPHHTHKPQPPFFGNRIKTKQKAHLRTMPPSSPPAQRPRCRLRVPAGQMVDLRLSSRTWVPYPKPKSRRGRNHLSHLRAVLADLDRLAIPATHANLKRLACGRGARLRLALSTIQTQDAASAAEPVTNKSS